MAFLTAVTALVIAFLVIRHIVKTVVNQAADRRTAQADAISERYFSYQRRYGRVPVPEALRNAAAYRDSLDRPRRRR
jgi:hypothetical protein